MIRSREKRYPDGFWKAADSLESGSRLSQRIRRNDVRKVSVSHLDTGRRHYDEVEYRELQYYREMVEEQDREEEEEMVDVHKRNFEFELQLCRMRDGLPV